MGQDIKTASGRLLLNASADHYLTIEDAVNVIAGRPAIRRPAIGLFCPSMIFGLGTAALALPITSNYGDSDLLSQKIL